MSVESQQIIEKFSKIPLATLPLAELFGAYSSGGLNKAVVQLSKGELSGAIELANAGKFLAALANAANEEWFDRIGHAPHREERRQERQAKEQREWEATKGIK